MTSAQSSLSMVDGKNQMFIPGALGTAVPSLALSFGQSSSGRGVGVGVGLIGRLLLAAECW